jgi:hypothetical protein
VEKHRPRVQGAAIFRARTLARDWRGQPNEGVMMNSNVGIWIDHKKAVIVSASHDGVTLKTVKSRVAAHPHYAGAQDGGGEKKYEERQRHQLDRFFDEVIDEMGRPEALLVFGPGEAKLELNDRVVRAAAAPAGIVGVQTTARLTDAQIVAKVKEHFGLGRHVPLLS